MTIEWRSIGVRFFSWISGIALVLAAVLSFRSPAAYGWREAIVALAVGIALLVTSELRIARDYPVTANAIDAAGIGILYATLYAMHARWHQLSLPVAFLVMAVVTAVAVYLATRRGSVFITLLGIIGGFVTAALLSSEENYPLAVFAYLLLLNIGITWVALNELWPWLLGTSVALTAIYEWAWVVQGLEFGRFALAAFLFIVFAVVGTSPLWYGATGERSLAFRRMGAAAALMPLLFAIYVAAHPNYGPQYYVLFGILLLVDTGLFILAWRGGPPWLHAAGGIATLVTLLVWFRVSYTPASWPWSLVWFVLFIALYLLRITPFAHLLFFVFIGLAVYEPHRNAAILAAMLALLLTVVVVTIQRGRAILGALAIALSSAALMMLHPPMWVLLAAHALLFAELFVVAWISERHVLAILAIPFYVAMIITAYSPQWSYPSPALTLLAIAVVPYAIFVAYPLALGPRVKESLAPHVAAALASLILFLNAWIVHAGLVPLAEAAVILVLLWRVLPIPPAEPRVTLVGSAALALFNVAVPMLLPLQWVVGLFAIETAALVWLFARLAHPALLVWATGLAALVFFRLAFSGELVTIWYGFVLCGLAMFAAAYLIRRDVPVLQRIFSIAGLFELWFLLNVSIANYFHSANGALNFDFMTSRPAEDAAYTVAWAVIATGLLILGFLIHWPAARGAALALLLAAILKCFFNDVPRLSGVHLVVSLLGLAVSLAVVGVTLQKSLTKKAAIVDLPA